MQSYIRTVLCINKKQWRYGKRCDNIAGQGRSGRSQYNAGKMEERKTRTQKNALLLLELSLGKPLLQALPGNQVSQHAFRLCCHDNETMENQWHC